MSDSWFSNFTWDNLLFLFILCSSHYVEMLSFITQHEISKYPTYQKSYQLYCRLIRDKTKHFYVSCTVYLVSNTGIFFFMQIACSCLQQTACTALRFQVRDTYRKSSFFLLKEAMLLTLPCCIRVTPRKQGDIIQDILSGIIQNNFR